MIISASLPLINRNVTREGNVPSNQRPAGETVKDKSGSLENPPVAAAPAALDKQEIHPPAPERIDLRVLRLDPPSLTNQRALDAYHTTALLDTDGQSSFGSLDLNA